MVNDSKREQAASVMRQINKEDRNTPEAIDQLVIAHSDDESAWEAPIRVKKSKPAF